LNQQAISAEAIEAAAKALYEVYPSLAVPGDESSAVPWEFAHPARQYEDRKQARAALEVAAPYMLAEGWGQGYRAGLMSVEFYGATPNPYRSNDE
jgi:hypothetical protein